MDANGNPQVLAQAMGGAAPYTPTPYDTPPELVQALAAIEARRSGRPAGPSAEDIANKRGLNNLDAEAGMLMQLTGLDAPAQVGNTVFKQALAARQPQVTEKGTANPMTGEFTYDPDYLERQDEADRQRVLNLIAQGRQNHDSQQTAIENRRYDAHQRTLDRMELAKFQQANRPEQLVPIMGPDGVVHYGPKVAGAIPGAVGGGGGGEDEKKAAGWYDQAATALNSMHDATKFDAKAAEPTFIEKMAGRIPGVGDDIAYAAMSPARQKFMTSASSLSEALLRAATGAGVNDQEAKQKINEVTPRWGEDPSVTEMKVQNAYVYLQSLKTRAGRAKTTVTPQHAPAAASAPGMGASAPDDPLGLRGG